MSSQLLVVAYRFVGSLERELGEVQRELFSLHGLPSCRSIPPLLPLLCPREAPPRQACSDFPAGATVHLGAPLRREHSLVLGTELPKSVTLWCERQRERFGSEEQDLLPVGTACLCPSSPAAINGRLSRVEVDTSGWTVRTGRIELMNIEYELASDGEIEQLYWRSLWSLPVRKGSATTTRFRPDRLAE